MAPAVVLAQKKFRLFCLTRLLLPLCLLRSCPDVLPLRPQSRLASILVRWLLMVLSNSVLPSLLVRWRRGFFLGLPPCSRPQSVMRTPTLAALSVSLKSSAFPLLARPPRSLPTLALLRGRSLDGPSPPPHLYLPHWLFLLCQPHLMSHFIGRPDAGFSGRRAFP